MGVRILGEITEKPWNCFKLCSNLSGCVSKAPKAGARPAGSSSQVSLWLFPISVLLLALFSQALHLEGTQPHRRPSLATPATSSQESSRKTMIGPEWVMHLTLRPSYGSPVFTSWDGGMGREVCVSLRVAMITITSSELFERTEHNCAIDISNSFEALRHPCWGWRLIPTRRKIYASSAHFRSNGCCCSQQGLP